MGFKQWLIGGPEAEKALVPKSKEVEVKEVPVQAVIVAKTIPIPPPQPLPPPPSPSAVRETLVRPFQIRSIDHRVNLEGADYEVHVRDISWLDGGSHTFTKVTISKSGSWSVERRLMLTSSGRPYDDSSDMIGAFAQAGLAVNRKLIDACLFPIQNQILEIERRLKNFE